VVNASMSSEGEPCQCAALLSRFVPAGLPWAHLDIAGTAESIEDDELFEVGPTGYGTRLLAGLARDW
jgi:leucyl aminopeptidase